jgi:hypothetical protein
MQKCNCTVNKEVHSYNTINNDCHRYVHNLEVYNSKLTVESCISYTNLPNSIKQIGNNNQCIKELKDSVIKGCYYSVEDCLNEEFCNWLLISRCKE